MGERPLLCSSRTTQNPRLPSVKWMQEAEMKHQLPAPLTCIDHAWSPTCQAWIRPPELCCAVCLVHTHGWHLGSLHAWCAEGTVPAGPWGLHKSYKAKLHWDKISVVEGGSREICMYMYIWEEAIWEQPGNFILTFSTQGIFKRKYMSFICQKSRNPNTRCLNSKMSKGVRYIKKLQKEKSLNPLSGRCWHVSQVELSLLSLTAEGDESAACYRSGGCIFSWRVSITMVFSAALNFNHQASLYRWRKLFSSLPTFLTGGKRICWRYVRFWQLQK